MSEIPDRKVLKDVLARLKANILKVESGYREAVFRSYQDSQDLLIKIQELEKKYPAAYPSFSVLVAVVSRNYSDLNAQSLGVIDDLKLYIESLEKYSAELDQAFWGSIEKQAQQIIEQQKKQEEEQAKLQQKPDEKKSTGYIK